jgi:hypothetical protein
VLEGDKSTPWGEEGVSTTSIFGNLSHGSGAHKERLALEVGEAGHGFGLGTQHLEVGDSQGGRHLVQVLAAERSGFDGDESPVGEADRQGKNGQTRSRSDVDPNSPSVQGKADFGKEGGEGVQNVAFPHERKVLVGDQVLGACRLSKELFQGPQLGQMMGWG